MKKFIAAFFVLASCSLFAQNNICIDEFCTELDTINAKKITKKSIVKFQNSTYKVTSFTVTLTINGEKYSEDITGNLFPKAFIKQLKDAKPEHGKENTIQIINVQYRTEDEDEETRANLSLNIKGKKKKKKKS